MDWNRRQIGIPVAVFVFLAAATGCTGTDVLNPGNFELRFGTGTDPADSGFDCVLLNFRELAVRALDGVCSATSTNPGEPCGRDLDCPDGSGTGECEGAVVQEDVQGGIVVISDPGITQVSFEEPGAPCAATGGIGNTLPEILLSSGLYRIDRLTVGTPRLVNDAGMITSCQGSIGVEDNYDPVDLRFTVSRDEPNAIRFVMNVPALQAALVLGPGCDTFFAEIASILEIQ